MEKRLQSNFWKYTLLLVANKRVFAAILGTYYLSVPGVTPKWLGIILLAGSVAGFIFEIPSGYFSDKIGHKKALVISRLLMISSTLFFVFAEAVPFLIIGAVLMSVSNAFFSGTGSAFMHDTFRGLNRESEYSRVMGKISAVGFAVPLLLSITVPFFVSISYQVPLLVGLFMDIVSLFAVLSLVTPNIDPDEVKEIGVTNFRQVLKEGYRLKFFKYATFTAILGGILMASGAFRAPYQEFLGIPVIWFGVLFGIGRLLASLVLMFSGQIKTKIKDITEFYRYKLVIFAILFFILGLISSPAVVAIVFIVMNAFKWGLSRVSEAFTLEIIKASRFKATLLSVQAQIEEAVIAVASFGLGLAIDRWSYQSAFLMTAIIFVAVLLPLYFYIKKRHYRSI